MLRRPTSQKAFTLIEVLMAMTVLVVSFTAVIQAVTLGADMIDTARKQQIAQQIIDGEIALQRTSTWLWSPGIYPAGVVGIQEMGNSVYSITVNNTGTAVTDNTSNGRNDWDYFILDNNTELLKQAKGFTCQAKALGIRPMTGTVDMIAITWTVTWLGASGRPHTLTGVSYFSKNGLHLSYQK